MTALIAALFVSAATSLPGQQLVTRDARALCVPVASTPQQQAQGLMGVHKPRPMVFSFNPPLQVSFWMKDTPARLTGVWVAPGGLVIGYWHGKPYSTTLHTSPQPVSLVIEYPGGYRLPKRGTRVRLGRSCRLPSRRL